MFQKNFDGVIMLTWFLISAACLGLCMILECASASCDSQNFSHTSDPEELNKPLLDENSPENEFAKRTIVFLDGKKTKPQNLNTKPNQMMEFENYENHLPPKMDDKPGGDRKRNRGKRIFIKEDALKWPNKTIPYKINYGSYQNHTIIHIVMALAVYKFNRASCVRWVPHTNQPYYVEVIGNSAWCRTVPGFRRYNVHPLHISEKYCTSVSSALHEMMHVAGAVHEQSRSSDRYRVLNFRWVQIPKMDEPNYMGSDVSNARQYDLGSILQYPAGPGKAIYLNDPDLEYLTRIRHIDLSFYDKAELNAFYKCANPDHCAIYSICQNDGYLKRVGGLCYCECVDGLSGRDCTDVFTCPGCGGTINLTAGRSEMIDMVGYKTGMRCTWLIKGPEKTTIQVYINSLGLPMSRKRNCYHYIEIRDYLSGSRGKIICGNSSGETFTKKNLGPTNTMIVRFNSLRFKTLDPGNGFALTVTAVPSACSSSPCKYPATCKDGAHIDSFTCLCTEGNSGTNCDTVADNATVTDSFERDFSTLMKHGSSRVDFKWSTKKYWNLHDVNITAFDGYLMAILVNTSRASYFPYDSVAKLETSVVFERANRCLRFNYALANNDHVGYFRTTLTVRISSDSGTSNVVFNTTTGNKWASVGINLRAVNNMKIVFKGVYGYQHLALDNIRITPLLCRAVNPCDDVVCQNGGTCGIVVNNSTLTAHSQCSCQFGFSGQYCEKYICTEESCLNGACFPLSSSTYTCDCIDGWSGEKCDIYTCANVQCNQGRCEALSETETRCICDNGWHGQFCDSTSDY